MKILCEAGFSRPASCVVVTCCLLMLSSGCTCDNTLADCSGACPTVEDLGKTCGAGMGTCTTDEPADHDYDDDEDGNEGNDDEDDGACGCHQLLENIGGGMRVDGGCSCHG